MYVLHVCVRHELSTKQNGKEPTGKRGLTNLILSGGAVVDVVIAVVGVDETFVVRNSPILVKLGFQNNLVLYCMYCIYCIYTYIYIYV